MLDHSRQERRARVEAPCLHHQDFLHSHFIGAVSGRAFDGGNPATGVVLARVTECDAADVDLAVTAERHDFEDGRWSRMTPVGRQTVLLKPAERSPLPSLTPIGGMQQSGFGRDLSLLSNNKYTALKVVWINYLT